MEISAKDIKGFKVYDHEATEPWGTVADICFDCRSAKVITVLVETISIIPITKVIDFNSINNIIKGAVVLKKDITVQNREKENPADERQIHFNKISKVLDGTSRANRLRDIKFNFETGAMTDIIFSKNIFSKKNSVGVNKIWVKDNTIFIEKNEGRSGNV